jgi:hypothetical protein
LVAATKPPVDEFVDSIALKIGLPDTLGAHQSAGLSGGTPKIPVSLFGSDWSFGQRFYTKDIG